MVAQEDKYELRPFINLWAPPTTSEFPMWFQIYRLDDEYVAIDISDYSEPKPGTIFQIGSKMFEFVDSIETRPAKGVFENEFGGVKRPTWFRTRTLDVTGSNLKYAGEENKGMVLINLNNNQVE